MRAAQHLDALDFDHVHRHEPRVARLPDAVDVRRDTRNAAHVKVAARFARGAAAHQHDVRHLQADVRATAARRATPAIPSSARRSRSARPAGFPRAGARRRRSPRDRPTLAPLVACCASVGCNSAAEQAAATSDNGPIPLDRVMTSPSCRTSDCVCGCTCRLGRFVDASTGLQDLTSTETLNNPEGTTERDGPSNEGRRTQRPLRAWALPSWTSPALSCRGGRK